MGNLKKKLEIRFLIKIQKNNFLYEDLDRANLSAVSISTDEKIEITFTFIYSGVSFPQNGSYDSDWMPH